MRQSKAEILYEDGDIIVCQKDAGIPVQTAKLGRQDYVSILKNYRADRGEEPYIGLVTRLDQPVEGILLFAKNQKAAGILSKQVQAHDWQKKYYAVVCPDHPVSQGESQTLVDWLLKDGKTNSSRVVSGETKGAKKAELSYRICQIKDDMALVEVDLKTGRYHQIRVQLSHAGLPILGDAKYGNGIPGKKPALCAAKISFVHPVSGKRMEYSIRPRGELFEAFKDVF